MAAHTQKQWPKHSRIQSINDVLRVGSGGASWYRIELASSPFELVNPGSLKLNESLEFIQLELTSRKSKMPIKLVGSRTGKWKYARRGQKDLCLQFSSSFKRHFGSNPNVCRCTRVYFLGLAKKKCLMNAWRIKLRANAVECDVQSSIWVQYHTSQGAKYLGERVCHKLKR